MAWNLKRPTDLPTSVERAVLENGTIVAEKYYIHELLCYSGSELYYHVQDTQTGEHLWLDELLPFQWCSLNYESQFVPLRKESGIQWEAVRNITIERLKTLQSLSEEDAIPEIHDIFEAYGTIFHTETMRNHIALHEHLEGKILSPKEALQMFTPILDSLAGLHEQGIFHGAITDTAIRLEGEDCILRDWGSCPHTSQVQEDVRAVSLLLYRAMTGETVFRDETAKKLPENIRNALYNGIYDNHLTIMQLWHQLHAKRPAKRIKPIPATDNNYFTQKNILKLFICLLFLFLGVCPIHTWDIWYPKTETVQKAENVLPDEIQMPELLYLPQEEAIQKLEDLDLHVILTEQIENPIIPEVRIVTQSPNAGAILENGDTVTLSVSRGWMSTVPEVSDMPIEKATEKLEKLGFIIETEEAVSDTVAPDSVISQDVEPDTQLERNSTIHLLVSIGRKDLDFAQTVDMPDCTGMTFEEAKTLLSEQFLYAVQADLVFDAKVPAGKIISQNIQAGNPIPQGTTVSMIVSLGAEKTSVPDVVSMTADEAKEAIENANLRCVLCYISDDEHTADSVISQNYPPESILPIHTEVWLNVSIGSASRVESLGGWSGNPLPEPNGEIPTEAPTEEVPQEDAEENPPVFEITPQEPEPVPENPELPVENDDNQELTNPPLPDIQ